MRVSPRSMLLLVSICAASLGFAFAARAEKTPVARYGRKAAALPWIFVAKAGDMESAALAMEGVAFRFGPERPSAGNQVGVASAFEDPASQIGRLARAAARERDLAVSLGRLGLDGLNPEAIGLIGARAPTPLFAPRPDTAARSIQARARGFNLPDLAAGALTADGARGLENAFAEERTAAEFFSIPREDLAKIYARLWQDSLLGAPGSVPDAQAPAPRQPTEDLSALAL